MNIISALSFWFFVGVVSLPAQSFSSVNVQNPQQKQQTLSEYFGSSYTVVDFWATWCKPCLKAMPKLEELHQLYKSKGVNFVGVSTDSPRNISKVVPRARALGVTYDIVLDPNSDAMNRTSVMVLPTLLILNKSGEEVYRHAGFQAGDEKKIAKVLDELLAK